MLRGQPCFEGSAYARFHFQAEPNFEAITQILFFLSPQTKEWFPNVIEDFQSCGDGHSRFYVPTRGSMHLRSEIMQKLKVSTGTGNVSIGTGNVSIGTQSC